jgi:hypothetical protein
LPQTTYNALRYPQASDSSNVWQYWQNLAEDVDQKVVTRASNSTARAALTKYDGMLVYETTTKRFFRWDATNTRWEYVAGPKFTWSPSLTDASNNPVTGAPLTVSGTYILRDGWLDFDAIFRFQGGIDGRTGALGMPLPAGAVAKVGEPHNLGIDAFLYTNADGNSWKGGGWVTPGATKVTLLFPATGAASFMQPFRNATGAGVTGSGVPLVSASYPLTAF